MLAVGTHIIYVGLIILSSIVVLAVLGELVDALFDAWSDGFYITSIFIVGLMVTMIGVVMSIIGGLF